MLTAAWRWRPGVALRAEGLLGRSTIVAAIGGGNRVRVKGQFELGQLGSRGGMKMREWQGKIK
jgi:hypothetical protein